MAGFSRNPAAALEQAFRRIQTERMADVPLLNPAVGVEALGFTLTDSGWLGVVVTPWFMNLMLLPAAGKPWNALATGDREVMKLPCGAMEFLGGEEEGLGPYRYCSLFSPMSGFADHAAARDTALEVARRLFEAPAPAPGAPGSGALPSPARRTFFSRSRSGGK